MTTKRVQASGAVTWTVVDGDGRVIGPVEEYLEFARQSDYSPNTVRSYARSLALWSTHLEQHGRCWDFVALTDFGSFLQAVALRVFWDAREDSPVLTSVVPR